MSRDEVENEKFMVAFGVDVVTGSYAQVWKQPWREQDAALVLIDNTGVTMRKEAVKELPESAISYLGGVSQRYRYAREQLGNKLPNVDYETVAALFTRLGLPGLGKQIYKAFDEETS